MSASPAPEDNATERVFDPYREPHGEWVTVTVSLAVGSRYSTYTELSAAVFAAPNESVLVDAKGEDWVVHDGQARPRGPWEGMRFPVTMAGR